MTTPTEASNEAVESSAVTIRSGSRFEAALVSVAIASMAGAVAGGAWGGVGGRVAMRILFLTSDDRVRGLISDDGFEIGVISGATIFLLIFTTVLGAIAGLLYGLVRLVIGGPTWLVALGVGSATAIGAGASIVNSDGVDFRLLEPLWLAVALFVFIPGAWGVTVVWLQSRLMRSETLFPTVVYRIDPHRWGVLGWLVLVAMSVLGVMDLSDDIGRLT